METKNKKSELEEFLDYCTERKRITESQSEIILEKIGQQLAWNLASDEFEWLNEKFEEWRKKRKEIQEKIIPQILPEKYMFLSNEKYLIDYFLDRDLTNLNIEYYKNRMEKNIGILKKYIDDDVIWTFMKEIVEYPPEYLEKLLSVLHEIWVNKSEDLIKLRGLGIITTDNLITLNEIWINKPEDLIKLKGILPISDTEGIKKVLETLKSVWITKVDDLVKLEGIIKSWKYYSGLISRRSIDRIVGTRDDIILNIKNLKELWVETADDFSKFEKTICQGKPETVKENIEVLKECWIESVDDLAKFQNIICEIIKIKAPVLDSILKKNWSVRIKKNISVLRNLWIESVDDLAKLQDIVILGAPRLIEENIKALQSVWITSVDDFVNLGDIIVRWKAENILVLKECWITSVDDFVKLSDIIEGGKKEVLLALKEIGIVWADNLEQLKGIITTFETKNVRENLLVLKDMWIFEVRDLKELGTIIKKCEKGVLLSLKEIWITKVEDLKSLESIFTIALTQWKCIENMKVLKEMWITEVDDLVKFQDIILKGKNSKDIKLNILALKESWITEIDDLVKFPDIILECWDHDGRPNPIIDQRIIIKNNILELRECWIIEVDDLVKFQDIIIFFRYPPVSRLRKPKNRFWKLKEQISVLKECWITEVDDLVKLKHIIIFGQKENILVLKDIWITEVEDLIQLRDIIIRGKKENILVLKDMWIIEVEDLANFKDIITSRNIETKKIKSEFDILFYEWKIQSPKKLSKFQKAVLYENISKYKEYFWDIKDEDIGDIEMKVLSGINLPENLKFKENDHKWYLKFIWDIIDTDYYYDKKSKMIEKIVTLRFNEAEKYLEIFKMLDTSISMDVQRVKNELIDEVLESDNPLHVAKQIINIFERNNLPLTWKIFKVFELLYPKDKFNRLLNPVSWEWTKWSPVLNNYKDEWKNVYELIYKDLMNIAIKSGDRSLKQYLKTFISSEKLLRKFEWKILEDWFNPDDEHCLKWLSSQEKEELLYLFRKISVLYNRYFWKEIEEWNLSEWNYIVSDRELLEFYNKIKKWFGLREWKSIYDRLKSLLYANWLKYHSAEEVLEQMNKSKKEAHERWLNLYNESKVSWWKIKFPKWAFLKWVGEGAFSKIINRWVTCREYLWWWDDWKAAWSDCTPFDIDWLYLDSPVNWTWYWDVLLITDINRCNIVDTGKIWISWYQENQYELFKTWVVSEEHYWIRTWIPTTEVDYIIYNWGFESKTFQDICYEVARNGYYIPITDKEWNVKFTPEMYHNIRLWFNYMDYYDWFDVEQVDWKWITKETDNTVTKEYKWENRKINDEKLRDLVSNNSPSSEKYAKFAKENRELAENTIEWIKRILEDRCWIKFNSKYDSSITWAEIHDSGSTWRWTDIPTKDVDLDFTLLLDANDYKRVDEIRKIIHEEIWTQQDDDHWVIEWWNQIKSKINNIWKSDDRPNWVPLDLLILKKSQVINYSSSDAMKEKLNFIASNPETWIEDLDWIRTNVIIMKKLLKAKECYKKPEWWISWIWVENWITQHHWSFVEALESFEQVVYWWEYKPWKKPIPLEEFQKRYPMYDAWENYKDGGNDNFVYKLKEKGYRWILEIVETLRMEWIEGIKKLIKKYEEKKEKYIG